MTDRLGLRPPSADGSTEWTEHLISQGVPSTYATSSRIFLAGCARPVTPRSFGPPAGLRTHPLGSALLDGPSIALFLSPAGCLNATPVVRAAG